MARLPSPYTGKPFKKVEGSKGYYYDQSHQERIIQYKPLDPEHPERGIIAEEKEMEVPHNPEIVDLHTGQSNTQYWQPDLIVDGNCRHEFDIVSMGNREIECRKCSYTTVFHAGRDIIETDGKVFVVLNRRQYPIGRY